MATLPIVVRGTDGAVPQRDPNGLWKPWNYNEIYFGFEATGKYVPKIDDLVYHIERNKVYRVADISDLLIPTLVVFGESEADNLESQVLIGDGLQPTTFRMYLDTSKLPFEASIDSRHDVNGSGNSYARIFRGVDVSVNGKVISAVFSGATYLDDKIPLELALYDDHTNLAKKVVPSFNTTADLPDGEICTVVIYNANNSVTSVKRLLVERTSHIRAVNSGQKYISGISCKSPFMNGNDAHVIDYPLNVPIGSLNIIGVVHYSDGSVSEMPVDGSKFVMRGLENFIATRAGQRVPLVLAYRLGQNEAAYQGVSADGKWISEPYTIVTTLESAVYSPKLFGYPRWNPAQSKYDMKWWLMDLTRSTLLDATDAIQYNDTGEIFDGAKYNGMQFLSIRVKLSDVSVALPAYIHTQTMYVRLTDPTLQVNQTPLFEVGQENVAGDFYGTNLVARTIAIDQNNFEIDIGNNSQTLNEWVERLFYKSKPVFSLYREQKAPMPTHFTVMNSSVNPQTFSIANWNKRFNIFTNIQDDKNLVIRWDRQLDGQTLQLGVTEIPIQML